jgi:hypothetical protein
MIGGNTRSRTNSGASSILGRPGTGAVSWAQSRRSRGSTADSAPMYPPRQPRPFVRAVQHGRSKHVLVASRSCQSGNCQPTREQNGARCGAAAVARDDGWLATRVDQASCFNVFQSAENRPVALVDASGPRLNSPKMPNLGNAWFERRVMPPGIAEIISTKTTRHEGRDVTKRVALRLAARSGAYRVGWAE